jgi:hypothetical protein
VRIEAEYDVEFRLFENFAEFLACLREEALASQRL